MVINIRISLMFIQRPQTCWRYLINRPHVTPIILNRLLYWPQHHATFLNGRWKSTLKLGRVDP